MFIDRKRVKIYPGNRRQFHIVKLVPVTIVEPETVKRNAERTDRVEHAQAVDAKICPVVNMPSQARPNARQAVIWLGPVKLPRGSLQFFCAVVAFE